MKKLERIMLIDDDQITNTYNEFILRKLKIADHFIVFQDANKAIKYFESDHEQIDLILLDLNMPLMDGWEFVEEFEKIQLSYEAIIVVVLTSSADIDDRERVKQFKSIKKFINKPLDMESAKQLIALFSNTE